jgi:hypothetical protein
MEPKALEAVLEGLLECYSLYLETHQSLSTIKTIQSTSVIKIVRDRNKPIHRDFLPFGVLSREILEGKINVLDHLIRLLDPFSSDFVRIRYYEMQSREFVISYLKIGSVSTYKRYRHRVLAKCFPILQKIESLDIYFPELIGIFHPTFTTTHQLTDEAGNPISSEEQSE